MPRQRGSTRRTNSTLAPRRGARGRIHRSTRSWQPPSHYGSLSNPEPQEPDSEPTNISSESEYIEPSEPEFSHSPSTNMLGHSQDREARNSTPRSRVIGSMSSQPDTPRTSHSSLNASLNLTNMRELLRSYEENIVD